jgi:hypothetical protein
MVFLVAATGRNLSATPGAIQQRISTTSGIVVLKLNADGNKIILLAVLDLRGTPVALALDPAGNIYAGISGDPGSHSVVVKLNPAASEILLHAPVAGPGDVLADLTVDAKGTYIRPASPLLSEMGRAQSEGTSESMAERRGVWPASRPQSAGAAGSWSIRVTREACSTPASEVCFAAAMAVRPGTASAPDSSRGPFESFSFTPGFPN